MWKPIKKDGEDLGLSAVTVGELKEILNQIPDTSNHYLLSVIGTSFGMVIDDEEEIVLMDEVDFLENLLAEQEEEFGDSE